METQDEIELNHIRKELDRMASQRLAGPLDWADRKRYKLLTAREEQLLRQNEAVR